MKLMRIGPKGAERPAMLAEDGTYRDLSELIPDLSGPSLGHDTLARREWTEHGGHAARFLFATVSRPSRTAALVTATR
jgi:hypothetical protein